MKREDCKHSDDIILEEKHKVLVEMINDEVIQNITFKMIKISNQIHQSSFRGSADTIVVHPKIKHLIRSFKNNITIMTDETLSDDVIFLKFSFEKIPLIIPTIDKPISFDENWWEKEWSGDEITVINMRFETSCTEQEVEEYKKRCCGYINLITRD